MIHRRLTLSARVLVARIGGWGARPERGRQRRDGARVVATGLGEEARLKAAQEENQQEMK